MKSSMSVSLLSIVFITAIGCETRKPMRQIPKSTVKPKEKSVVSKTSTGRKDCDPFISKNDGIREVIMCNFNLGKINLLPYKKGNTMVIDLEKMAGNKLMKTGTIVEFTFDKEGKSYSIKAKSNTETNDRGIVKIEANGKQNQELYDTLLSLDLVAISIVKGSTITKADARSRAAQIRSELNRMMEI